METQYNGQISIDLTVAVLGIIIMVVIGLTLTNNISTRAELTKDNTVQHYRLISMADYIVKYGGVKIDDTGLNDIVYHHEFDTNKLNAIDKSYYINLMNIDDLTINLYPINYNVQAHENYSCITRVGIEAGNLKKLVVCIK